MVVSDTFGRPWRQGLTDVAIGVSGIAAVVDLRDTPDALGRTLVVTEVAIADEIASAAELVMGKAAERSRRDRARPRRVVVRRGLGARARAPASGGSLPMRSPIPDFVEHRRSIRAFTADPVDRARARHAGRGGVRRARAAPLAAVALRRDRHRRGQDRARARHGRAVARRPHRRRRGAGAHRRARGGVARQAHDRARARARAASRGTGSTAIPTRRASARSGAWHCCRSAPRSRTSC